MVFPYLLIGRVFYESISILHYCINTHTHTHKRHPISVAFRLQGHKSFESKKNLGKCMSVLLCTKEQKRPAKSSSEQRRRGRVQRAFFFLFFSFWQFCEIGELAIDRPSTRGPGRVFFQGFCDVAKVAIIQKI